MSLWWAKRDQLDRDQVRLIEALDLQGDYLVLGPPGSGKTNVLLRRAQFVRTQNMPNVMVLTFTRALTEFLKTGCVTPNGAEIFPISLITTIESWIREIYRSGGVEMPDHADYKTRKVLIASEAAKILPSLRQPKLDAIFVDEAQDLMPEEVALIKMRAHHLFFVGDDKQKIYSHADGLPAIRALAPKPIEEQLEFHYRVAPEICAMADRIFAAGGRTLSETCHYQGPRPGRISVHAGDTDSQLDQLIEAVAAQLRVYGDRIQEGDRLGIVVPKRDDRDLVAEALDEVPALAGKWQIVRARTGDSGDRDFDPTLDPQRPILIMTEPACKGLEFRALHWLFVDEQAYHRTDERYYTIVTRAKTSIDLYAEGAMPNTIARSYAPPAEGLWS